MRIQLLAIAAVATVTAALIPAGCSSNDCADKLTCPPGSTSSSANVGGSTSSSSGVGGTGGAGGGGQGGTADTCGNGVVDMGEVCFGDVMPVQVQTTVAEPILGIAATDCNSDGWIDLVAVSTSPTNDEGHLVGLPSNAGAFDSALVAFQTVNKPISFAVGELYNGSDIVVGYDHGGYIDQYKNSLCNYAFTADFSPATLNATNALVVANLNTTPPQDWAVAGTTHLFWKLDNDTNVSDDGGMLYADVTAIVAGDFNNNSFTDLAYTDTSPNRLLVRVGNGTNFPVTVGQTYSLPEKPVALETAYLTNDNYLDIIALGTPGGTVAVLRNVGGAMLSLATPIASIDAIPGTTVCALDSADIDADEDIDIVVLACGPSFGSVHLLLNDGFGKLVESKEKGFPIMLTGTPTDIVVAPLQQATTVDIAVARADLVNNSGVIDVFLSNP